MLFATGSGISPIRALITSGALKGRDVTLYYGTASGETTAFLDEFETWKKACGVREVKHVQSQARSIHWSPYDRVGVVNAVP